ncbi:MAG: tetratricopeptide repeat protein [Anaerolineales bacterium]|nr:tetratricopeptide repeat protein [Anaerolineales bacterium]MCB0019440.1 tetratricopeptide repeat protein [Anaerolineales bacterium]
MTKELNERGRQLRAQALFSRGTELLQKQQPEQALGLLQQAHKLDPENRDLTLNLSGAYILTRKFKQAIPLLEKLLEEEPQNVMVWTNLGAAYLGNPILARPEEQDRAIEAFKQALVHDPIAPNVAYNIGLIYRDQKNIDEATYWFRKAIQANPRDNDARAWLDKMESAAEEQE